MRIACVCVCLTLISVGTTSLKRFGRLVGFNNIIYECDKELRLADGIRVIYGK